MMVPRCFPARERIQIPPGPDTLDVAHLVHLQSVDGILARRTRQVEKDLPVGPCSQQEDLASEPRTAQGIRCARPVWSSGFKGWIKPFEIPVALY